MMSDASQEQSKKRRKGAVDVVMKEEEDDEEDQQSDMEEENESDSDESEVDVTLSEAEQNKILRRQLREAKRRLQEAEQNKILRRQLREAMQKAKKATEFIEHTSVRRVLKGVPSMHELESATPSVLANEDARNKVVKFRKDLVEWKKAASGNKVEPPKSLAFHEPAEIEACPFGEDLDNIVNSLQINVLNKDGNPIQSEIALKQERSVNKVNLDHHNETSPQTYLAAVFEDAIACCGFTEPMQVVREASLFSLRPDLVVVVVEGRLLLAVEVKNPSAKKPTEKGDTHIDLFKAETAAGQTLDYLKALKQQGVDWPFALLSTYNESVIAIFPEDVDQYKQILLTGLNNAQHEPPKRHKLKDTKRKPAKDSEKKAPPPPTSPYKPTFYRKLASLPNSSSNDPPEEEVKQQAEVGNSSEDASNANATDYDYRGRKIIYSRVFRVEFLYKIAVLLLESSLESSRNSRENGNGPLVPNEGDSFPSKEVCTLYEHGFSYEKVPNPTNVKVTYNHAPRRDIRKYHVLCQVGQGGTGKTILCSSSSGKLFAVKLFLIKASLKYDEEDKNKEHNSLIQEKRDEAGAECQRWLKLAPEPYKKYCRVITLNGLPAITMPYFPAVPLEKRKAALGPIQKRLEEVSEHGLYYNGDGLRWRHFGCRWHQNGKMEITLLDLESLGPERQNIAEQINTLRTRMNAEEMVPVRAVIV